MTTYRLGYRDSISAATPCLILKFYFETHQLSIRGKRPIEDDRQELDNEELVHEEKQLLQLPLEMTVP